MGDYALVFSDLRSDEEIAMDLSTRQPLGSRIMQKMAIVLALFTVTAGCDTATGGGWIDGNRSDRATFGFNVQCRDSRVRGMPVATLSYGQLDWTDGDVSFHGIVDPQSFNGQTCEDLESDVPTITFTGTYTPHHAAGSGTFTATVTDVGEPGIDEDLIEIDVIGTYIYSNAGTVQGGNVQVS